MEVETEIIQPLSDFFSAIATDGRIGIKHIGLFAVLLQYRQQHNCGNPIRVYSRDIFSLAKVSTQASYMRCLRELSEFGYVRYVPSKKRNQASKIYLPEGI